MAAMMMFSDYACPWCYLGRARLKRALQGTEHGIEVVHFPLSPDTPQEGRDAVAYLTGRGIDLEAATTRLKLLLAEEGLPYSTQLEGRRLYNTARAQELALWAEGQPGGAAIHDALFHAYHVDNIDVNNVDVLVGIAESVGLDGSKARASLESRSFQPLRERHWQAARQSGVQAVPTYAMNGKGVVGAQPVEVITRLLEQ